MRTATRKVQVRVLLTICALAVTYAFYALYEEKFDTWNSQIADRLFGLRSRIVSLPAAHDTRIVHVDANLNAFRSQHAQVIRNLSQMGVASIAFDTVFSERVGDEEDLPLMSAAERAGNVFLGVKFDLANPPARSPTADLNAERKNYLESTKWHVTVKGDPNRFPQAHHPLTTYPALASAAQGLGHLNITPDSDGILRRIPLLVRYEDAFYPSIALQVASRYLGVSPENIAIRSGRYIELQNLRDPKSGIVRDMIIPIDAGGNMILNYTQAWEHFPHFSYSEILQANQTTQSLQQLQPELSDKIVVLSEAVATPFRGRPFSSENRFSSGTIHSIVIHSILQGSFVKILSGVEVLFIEILLLVLFFLVSIRFSALPLSLATVLLSGSVIIVGAFAFVHFNLIIRFVQPLLILYGALVLALSASAVEKAILLAETERARKLAERELEIGREIQSGFFPEQLPAAEGWELVTHFQAARHVSGDFYDAFSIGNGGHIGFVVADVCDKGVGAALFMALFRSLIRVLSGSAGDDNQLGSRISHHDPARTLQHTIQSVNNYISTTHEADSMFSTIFFGILDPDSGELFYINGGHEPPMIIAARKIKTYLCPTGPAVGLYPKAEFSVVSTLLEPGDILLAYTDGVVDARNKSGEYFAKDRLANLATGSYPSAKALVDRLVEYLNEYKKGQDQFDDITILSLRRRSSAEQHRDVRPQ